LTLTHVGGGVADERRIHRHVPPPGEAAKPSAISKPIAKKQAMRIIACSNMRTRHEWCIIVAIEIRSP
jgi:hypothetical protein